MRWTLLSSASISLALAQSAFTSLSLIISHLCSCSICLHPHKSQTVCTVRVWQLHLLHIWTSVVHMLTMTTPAHDVSICDTDCSTCPFTHFAISAPYIVVSLNSHVKCVKAVWTNLECSQYHKVMDNTASTFTVTDISLVKSSVVLLIYYSLSTCLLVTFLFCKLPVTLYKYYM